MDTHDKDELMHTYYLKNNAGPDVTKRLRRPSSRITTKIQNLIHVVFRILFLITHFIKSCVTLVIKDLMEFLYILIITFVAVFIMAYLLIKSGLLHSIILPLLGINL